ncbi:MAG TPA: radical SAM protein [Candidatus Omnitrophota bacterium]|nr:radical SAM protein [Candidatus Omnitrophota bacterium]
MAILKSCRFFFGLLRSKLLRKNVPLTVIINLTNRCNSRCRHCYAEYYNRSGENELSTEKVKEIILALRQNGCQRISFGGGEPLLRKDIGELIAFVNSLGMYSTLNSNGILIPQFLSELKTARSRPDSLAVSLDGRPEHHDRLRGAGTAAKALNGIIAARKAGIRVHSNTVLSKHNLNDIDYLLDLARRYGFKTEFSLVISNIFGNSLPEDEFKPSTEEFRNALLHIIRRKKEGAPILTSAKAFQSVLNCWKDFSIEGVVNAPPPEGMPGCPAGKFFGIIDPDGTLWACPHLIGKIDADNVLETGVARAWQTASRHPCKACYQIYHHEFGLLMDLNPAVIWNYVKS